MAAAFVDGDYSEGLTGEGEQWGAAQTWRNQELVLDDSAVEFDGLALLTSAHDCGLEFCVERQHA